MLVRRRHDTGRGKAILPKGLWPLLKKIAALLCSTWQNDAKRRICLILTCARMNASPSCLSSLHLLTIPASRLPDAAIHSVTKPLWGRPLTARVRHQAVRQAAVSPRCNSQPSAGSIPSPSGPRSATVASPNQVRPRSNSAPRQKSESSSLTPIDAHYSASLSLLLTFAHSATITPLSLCSSSISRMLNTA